MKKLTTLLAVLLCIALALPCSAQAAYTPGETTKKIFADVWNSGKMIQTDLKLNMELDAAALGVAEDEKAMFDAVVDLLEQVRLSAAAGKLSEGVRLEMAAALGEASVYAAANLEKTGITLESDLIEGQKVTVKWETLLAMAGLTDGDIAMVMSMRDVDWNETMAQLLVAAEEYIALGAALAAPYAETVSAWTETLYAEVYENVPATEGYPAVAQQLDIYITEADLGVLLASLAAQLKEDANLAPMLDMLLAESGEDVTTAALCEEMTAAAAQMTDTETPLLLTLAMDEAGNLLFVQLFILGADGTSMFAEVIAVADDQGGMDYALNLMTLSAESELMDAFCLSGGFGNGDLYALLQLYAGGTPFLGWEYSVDTENVKTAEGLDGANATFSMSMNADDGGDSVQMVSSGTVNSYLTADGGEVTDTTTHMDMYVNGQTVTAIATGGMSLFPTENGLSGSYGVSESVPAMGITSAGADIVFSTKDYDAAATAALSEFALDTATSENIDELTETLLINAQIKLLQLMEALPEDVANALGA